MEFEVGEQVYLHHAVHERWVGKVGTVVDVDVPGPWPIEIEYSDGGSALVHEHEIQKLRRTVIKELYEILYGVPGRYTGTL